MTTLNEQRQAAYDRGDKAEVARLNVALLNVSKPIRTIDQIFADAMKKKHNRK